MASLALEKSVEYQALKKCENELIECLADVNLVSLARKAAECGLDLPKRLEQHLKSLHSEVPRQLMCRYLLFNVYDGLRYKTGGKTGQINTKAYEFWLKVLSGVRETTSVLSQIKHWHETLLANLAYQVSSGGEEDVVLAENHITDVTEALVGCSSKWKEIATSLGLPHNEIENLVAMMHIYKPVMRLKQVLYMWIVYKFPNSKPPTLENLLTALRSQIVGCGKEADQLRDVIKHTHGNLEVEKSRGSMFTEKLEIISLTQNATVPEGSSTLLEIEISTTDGSLNFKWLKNGEAISHEDHLTHQISNSHNGFNVSILWLYVTDLTVEGTSITCNIKTLDSEVKTLISKPIIVIVTTPVDQYKSVLNTFYAEQPEVPEDTWPPVSSNTYISLALIKQDGIQYAGEYGQCTIRGDADDIYENKESIVYKDAFNNLNSSELLLVEGRPGSGKTTLVHKVSQDWGRGKLTLKHNRLLILVHLRAFSSDPNINLHDILKCYYINDSTVNTISDYAEKHNGLAFCFILDGLDEYRPNKKNAFIFRLIRKEVLPRAIVIVASRPAAASSFRSIATRQVEVIGFLKDQIFDYIEKYPSLNQHKGEELHKYLDQHPNVHHMCYLPIHAAMVCFLFGHLAADLPETETEIYLEFTKCTILRFLNRNDDGSHIVESIEDLSTPQRDLYNKICKLAFEMTMSSRQVMKQVEAKAFICTQDERDFFGLITVDMMAMKCGFQHLYSFLHLTFQEFLGACYISELKEKEQFEFIEEYSKAEQLQQVWKFYCGLVKFSEDCKIFKALIRETEYGTLFKVHCCFESQQSHVCDVAVESKTLSFTDMFLSPSDFTEIAYVVSHAQRNSVEVLCFDGCVFGQECVDVFIKKTAKVVSTLCYYNCNSEQLQILNYFLQFLPSLEVLDITETNLGNQEIDVLTKELYCSNLLILKVGSRGNTLYSSLELQQKLVNAFRSNCSQDFNVCFSGIGKSCFLESQLPLPFYFHCDFPDLNMSFCNMTLARIQVLSHNLFCCRLTLISCGIDDVAVSYLAQGLNHCTQLEVLELSFNDIGDDGAVYISENIKFCTKLHTLDLSFNKIGNSGAVALADVFNNKSEVKLLLSCCCVTKYNDILKLHKYVVFYTLDISNRDLDDKNITLLASAMQSSGKCEDLLHLRLQNNRISFEGIKALNTVLVKCSNLLLLNLSSNAIGSEGIKHLRTALIKCCNLQVLNLSSNALGTEGAIVLGDIFKHCTKLHKLDVSSNYIDSSGALAISEGLKYCTNLLELKINFNDIGCDGAKAITKALTCVCLEELELHSNSIGREGAKALADALHLQLNFMSLAIGDNNIQDIGAMCLANSLKHCFNLNSLDISSNNIGRIGVRAISKTLKRLRSLNRFDISGNKLNNDADAQLITKALCNCMNLHDIKFGSCASGSSILAHVVRVNCLYKLDISGNNLFGDEIYVVAALKHCIHLRELDVSKNCIGTNPVAVKALANSLECLTSLSVFSISFNEIDHDGAKILSGGLVTCKNLCEFFISNNRIEDDGITALVNSPSLIGNLCVLDVANNNIGRRGARNLANALEQSKNLQELNISENDISDGLEYLCSVLKHCIGIRQLKVSHSLLYAPDDAIVLFITSLKFCYNLQELHIKSNGLSYNHVCTLAVSLRYCINLQKLYISDNNIESDSAEVLAGTLKCCTKLSVLDISGNFFLGFHGINALANVLKHCAQLCEINISNTCSKLGFKECHGNITDFVLALKHSSNLHKLDISANFFNDIGVKILSSSIVYCKYLVELNVNYCFSLFDKTYGTEASALKVCTKLRVLGIHGNGINDDGVTHLADALKYLSRLRTLDLSDNEIGLPGAVALGNALQHCLNLEKLDIRDNPIGSDGVKVLHKIVKNCIVFHST